MVAALPGVAIPVLARCWLGFGFDDGSGCRFCNGWDFRSELRMGLCSAFDSLRFGAVSVLDSFSVPAMNKVSVSIMV